MPLRVPEGCLGGGQQFGGSKQVRRVAATPLAFVVHCEKETGALESLARNPAGAQGSSELLLPYSQGFVCSRASAGQSREELEEFGVSFWSVLLLETWGLCFLLELMSSAPSVP